MHQLRHLCAICVIFVSFLRNLRVILVMPSHSHLFCRAMILFPCPPASGRLGRGHSPSRLPGLQPTIYSLYHAFPDILSISWPAAHILRRSCSNKISSHLSPSHCHTSLHANNVGFLDAEERTIPALEHMVV